MSPAETVTPRPARRRIAFPRRMILPSILLGLVVAIPFAAPLVTDHDPVRIAISRRLAAPSAEHWLGQDEFGRDRLARLLYGGQVSLTVAFVVTTIAGLVGTLFGPGVTTLIGVLSVLFFPAFARISFAEALRVSSLDFVEASRAIGTSSRRIVTRTVLPNIAGPLSVQYSLTAASAIGVESGLSFLGLGVVPPAASWGQMIRGARGYMERDPLGLIIPCLALTITIYSINFFCDRLRDTLDPKGRGGDGKDDLAAAARAAAAPDAPPLAGDAVADIRGLTLQVARPGPPVDLIEDVSITLRANQCTALVGESGSGKSLTSLALMGLLPASIRQAGGAIRLRRKSGEVVDIGALDAAQMESLRGHDAAMIFQEPMTSLNPVHRVGAQMVEAILAHRPMSKAEARALAIGLLQRVGINEAERRFDGFPHEMSGGMRQRVMIAMALSCEPKLLIADEPTTALDVTIQAEIIELLHELRREYANGMSLLFISHNLGIVAEIADRVAVMYSGQVVEEGPAATVLSDPRHPYTRALLQSMPSAHETLHSARGDRLRAISGTPPLPSARPSGCSFRDRCPVALAACAAARPPLVLVDGRAVRCLRSGEAA